MLAKTGLGAVPPDTNSGSTSRQLTNMVHGSPKCVALPMLGFCIRSPEEYANIHTASCSPVQHVECGSSAIGHFEGGPHESHGHPDTAPGRLNRLADTPECGLAIHQGAYMIPGAQGIRARCHKGSVDVVRH